MDAIVTARVPVEIKEQVTRILKEIGSSPTELINEAYGYVLKEHRIPRAGSSPMRFQGQHRVLSPEQESDLRDALRAVCRPVDFGEKTADEAIAEARSERYAHLA